jgi:hypothetical protein
MNAGAIRQRQGKDRQRAGVAACLTARVASSCQASSSHNSGARGSGVMEQENQSQRMSSSV